MGNVIPFGRASIVCNPASKSEAEAIQRALTEAMAEIDLCPACKGRGMFPFKNQATRTVVFAPCPCGGDDENRIDLSDFGGVA
jgi:hypothetical protein